MINEKDIVWLPMQSVIDAHRASLRRFGGAEGIRDEGAIAAALARPQQLLAYGDSSSLTLFDLSAALGFSILKNRHPFVDGNKRAGWLAMFMFLRINGYYVDAPEREVVKMIFSVAAGNKSEAELAAFLKDSSEAG